MFVVLAMGCGPGGALVDDLGDQAAGATSGTGAPVDLDEDGFGTDDCDDSDDSAYPGAPEVCDGVDNDCDGAADVDAVDAPDWYPDEDRDGHGDRYGSPVAACERPRGHATSMDDCDDGEPLTHPGAVDTWYDGIDSNCDGANDFDADADGHEPRPWGSSDDCDDANPDAYPGAPEVIGDGIDQDCDGYND